MPIVVRITRTSMRAGQLELVREPSLRSFRTAQYQAIHAESTNLRTKTAKIEAEPSVEPLPIAGNETPDANAVQLCART